MVIGIFYEIILESILNSTLEGPPKTAVTTKNGTKFAFLLVYLLPYF